jgi:hypothetical protein
LRRRDGVSCGPATREPAPASPWRRAAPPLPLCRRPREPLDAPAAPSSASSFLSAALRSPSTSPSAAAAAAWRPWAGGGVGGPAHAAGPGDAIRPGDTLLLETYPRFVGTHGWARMERATESEASPVSASWAMHAFGSAGGQFPPLWLFAGRGY